MSANRNLLRGMRLAALVLLTHLCAALGIHAQTVKPDVEVDSIGMSSLRLYRSGYWSELRATLLNRSNVERTVMLTAEIDEMNQEHFAKRVWLPAKSELQVKLPVYLDVQPPSENVPWSVEARLIDSSSGQEREIDNDDIALLLNQDRLTTGMAIEGSTEAKDSAARRLVSTLRKLDASIGTSISSIRQNDLPRHVAGFDGLDTFVVCLANIEMDAIQTSMLRKWVLNGGRLWIMADQTPIDFGRDLLGDDWRVVELDRPELTDLILERNSTSERLQFDYPVTMVRVLADDWEKVYTVNGYPALMRRSIGSGEVFVTTLGAQAWLDNEEQPIQSLRYMRDWLKERKGKEDAARQQAALDGYVQHQIGWRVLGLGPVAGILGLYLLGLVGVGLWLMRADRLERLSLVGVALAIIIAVGLSVLGLMRQGEIPTTLAIVQVAKFHDNQPYASLNNRVSIYVQPFEDRDLLMRGDAGLAQPSLAAQGGTVMRYVSVPPHAWQLEQLNLSASGAITDVRHVQTKQLDRKGYATVTWNNAGQPIGRVEGSAPTALEDAVIASRDARMALQFDGEGVFSSGIDQVLSSGEFLSTMAIVTQTQRVRLEVYRKLFVDPGIAEETSLFGWSKAMPVGLELAEDVTRHSAGLFSIPLRYERPASDAKVSLPFPLLRMDMLRNVPNVSNSSIFDERSRTFVPDISQEGDLMMRMTVPTELLPLRLDEVRFVFDINALGRDVSVLVYRNDQPQVVATFNNPLQKQTVTITGSDLPQLIDDWFGIGLRVSAGEPGQNSQWTLNSMQAHVTATVINNGDDE